MLPSRLRRRCSRYASIIAVTSTIYTSQKMLTPLWAGAAILDEFRSSCAIVGDNVVLGRALELVADGFGQGAE
jgi:hypothetical protein